MKKGKRPGTPLKWTIVSIRKQLPMVIFLVVLSSLHAATGTAAALCSKYVIDSAIGKNNQMFLVSAISLISVYIASLFLNAAKGYFTDRCRASIEKTMKANFFGEITEKKFEDISAYHSGTLLNRLTSDISVISLCATTVLPNLFGIVTKLVCAFIAIVSFEPWFALVFAVGGIIVFFATKIMRERLKKLHKKVQEEDDKVRSFWQESLTNLLAVKVFSNEKNMTEKSDHLQDNLFKARLKRSVFNVLTGGCYSGVMYTGYLFAFFWCATRLILDISFSYGSFTAIMQLVNQVQQPFSSFSGMIPQYYNAMASAERIMEIEAVEDEEQTDDDFDYKEVYDHLKTIKINQLSFAYKRDKVFENLEFEIDKGDFAAIVGHSGIGKSTLFKIMLGVYSPRSGSIDLVCDDKVITCSNSTRKLFSYVPQGNLIFSGTIRENILFVKDDVSEEEINKALKISCADEFISKLPDGIDTLIGEKGLGLSEGQAQRIAIARALLSDAPILLLDEATSALDAVTEAQVLENFKKLEQKTCIIVTHRKQALNVCNKKWEITAEN